MFLSIRRRPVFRVEIFALDFLQPVRAVVARISEMRKAVEGRRAIASMDARMLSDIGLSRSDALIEVSRRPWDTASSAWLEHRGR